MTFIKNQYPTNTVRNDYSKNRKNSTVETPLWLAEFLFNTVYDFMILKNYMHVFDIGCHKGNLSDPFTEWYHCTGIDASKAKYHSTFIHKDFFKYHFKVTQKTLFLCNPPFNITSPKIAKQASEIAARYGIKNKPLLPELFLQRLFELYGPKIPLVFFAPMGVLKNQRLDSPRWKWLRDCGAKITSELELPIDVYIPEGNEERYKRALNNWHGKYYATPQSRKKREYPENLEYEKTRLKRKYKIVLVHSSVLFFNIPGLPAKMFLDK